MKRASYKKDFQSWKGIMALKLLCCNIVAGRFDWKKYCTPQSYCGQEICVVPLHCSYGQIGYTVQETTFLLSVKHGYHMCDAF